MERANFGLARLQEGCRERWNSKYKDEEMTRMAMVYQSDSQDSALNMEAHLIDKLEDDILNGTGGGGGKRTKEDKEPYIVYIAWMN